MEPIVKVGGVLTEGNALAKEGKAMQDQYRRQATAAKAEGTRASSEIRRQGAALKSDATAAIAASGGVTTDASSTKMLSDIENVVNYNALAAIYGGNRQADEDTFKGNIARWKGKTGKIASRNRAFATVIDMGKSAYSSYGGGK